MNILLLSVGTRNKIVQYFKKELDTIGNVVATDMSPLAPALYEADRYYIVPRITDKHYVDIILDICTKEKINGILSLIDPELSLLARNIDRFQALGVQVIGSSYALCERSLDKMKMYEWLVENGYRCARSYARIDFFDSDLENGKIQFPVILKPIRGSASLSVQKVNDKKTLHALFDQVEGAMIQEFLHGQEIGIDCYIDTISHEVISIFSKKKLLMRAGETDKAVSFIDPKLNALVEKFVAQSGFVGPIDIDVFEQNGEYLISEVNPRFGGGYPHAYSCGCNHIKYIINNVQGAVNKKRVGIYREGVFFMKYNEIKIIES